MGFERNTAVPPRLLALHRALLRHTEPGQFIELQTWRRIVRATMLCDTRERIHDHTEQLEDWGLIEYQKREGVRVLHVEPNQHMLALIAARSS